MIIKIKYQYFNPIFILLVFLPGGCADPGNGAARPLREHIQHCSSGKVQHFIAIIMKV